MKKKRLAGLMLFAMLAATSCGTVPTVEFQANWYRNTSIGESVAETYEHLEYAVTMPVSDPQGGLSVSYTNGTYQMTLTSSVLTLDGGNKEEGYTLETALSVDVQFTYNGQASEVFHDETYSRVEFRSVRNDLKPVTSVRTVLSHTPLGNPVSLETSYVVYHYSYAFDYDDAVTKADMTYTDLSAEGEHEPAAREIELTGKGTYLDNEEILFALRGINFSQNSAASFRTYNTVMGSVQNVALRKNVNDVTESVDFERDGVQFKQEELPAQEVNFGFGNNIGQARIVVLAKQSDPSDNENRNVPLRIDSPIVRNLGTLRYTLKKAVFTKQ